MAIQLTIRAGGKLLSWPVEDWTALIALATLSAEPDTLHEYLDSLRRYIPDHNWDETGQAAAIEDAINDDGPSCFIDLDSQTVFASGGYELPQRREVYDADENDQPEGIPVAWLNIPDDWLFEDASDDWLTVISERTRERVRRQRIDTRAVLFGRPMLEFIAKRILAASDNNKDDDHDRDEHIRSIHAQWLMSPRSDLLGRTPREVLLRNRNQIDLELQFRSQQWSMQGCAPPALSKDSAAYRFGGYGTIEIVTYFDLMRSLLQFASELAGERPAAESMAEEDELVQRLLAHRDAFLNAPPDDADSGASCRELIESERRRVPITADGSHLDCDCPICQAIADGASGGSPAFLFFDGHHLELEDEFAFSLSETHEEWENDSVGMGSFSDEEFGPAEKEPAGDEAETAWISTFADWEKILGPGGSPQVAKLAIGFQLAEVVSELQHQPAGQNHIDALNAAFSRFRQADERMVAQSAVEELRDGLEQVAASYEGLIPRCADLQSRLDEVMRALP